MKMISSFAIAVALLAGGAGAPAFAQSQGAASAPAAPAAPARKYKFSKEGQRAIAALQKALAANDPAGYQASLAAADAAAQNSDDRYAIGQLRLSHAIAANDDALKIAAIDALIASGGATAAEMPNLYRNLGALHFTAKRYEPAAAAFEKLVELTPNDGQAVVNLAEMRAQQKRLPEAVSLMESAIQRTQAAGQPVPEMWRKRALQLALDGNLAPKMASLSRDLIATHPTAENWRNALLIYRQNADLDDQATLDTLRLMRTAKALSREDEYVTLASLLGRANYPAEAEAVIDEGVAAGKLRAASPRVAQILQSVTPKISGDRGALPGLEGRARSEATGGVALRLADGYFGHADYAKAAEFYRTALQKGSVDANVAQTRLGVALALAGRRAEAETAFKAVTGPRAGLANFWMLWLAQRA